MKVSIFLFYELIQIKGVVLGPLNNTFSNDDIFKINVFYEWECAVRKFLEDKQTASGEGM
jgi:hypothetical protein